MNILMFEGADKAGKTSLIKEVNRQSNYQYLCIDRFTGSAYVYDVVYERPDRKESIAALENELALLDTARFFVVLVTCEEELQRQRIAAFDDLPEDHLARLEKTRVTYTRYAEETPLPVIRVDTSSGTPESSANYIISICENYGKEGSNTDKDL